MVRFEGFDDNGVKGVGRLMGLDTIRGLKGKRCSVDTV